MARRIVFLALGIVLLSTWISPFRRELSVGDETKYSKVVREMHATGAWFLPTLNGAPFAHKPPLHFWLIDLLTVPMGVYSMWPFVIPSLLAFLFLLWLMMRMGGPLAAFVCGTSLMVWASAQTARMDVSFTAFLTLGVWMLQRFFDRDDRRALLIAGIAIGIATLIKGPMAPVIAVVLFLFEAWRRRRVPRANYVPALLAMVVIPILWVVPALIIGGQSYAHEVIVKQTLGRAIATWVHKAPPWFYLEHLPALLFPWFFLALFALRGANRFYLTWIAAVLVPYSMMSSKLDVYMMALIPPVALMIAEFIQRDTEWHRSAHIVNVLTLAILVAVAFIGPRTRTLAVPVLATFFLVLAITAGLALVVALTARSLLISTLLVGIVPIITLTYMAIAFMPTVNEMTTPRPLIAALVKQHVAPEQIALYSCPHLWSRDFPRDLERVRYVDAGDIDAPTVIATSRVHAPEIAAALRGYRRVDQVRMIGKWFDVYRR